MNTTKEFKVATISSNTNSFGLNGVILMARDGEAWEAATYCMGEGFALLKGDIVNLPVDENGRIVRWVSLLQRTFEIPRQLPKAPAKVVREVWRTGKADFINARGNGK